MSQPSREDIDRAVSSVLFDADNHPYPSAALGRDFSLMRRKITDAVMQELEYLELKKKLDDDFPDWT